MKFIPTDLKWKILDLQNGVGIDVRLHIFTINKYANTEYNNEHRNRLINDNVSTSTISSVLALTSPSVTSTNDEECSLVSPINEKIRY